MKQWITCNVRVEFVPAAHKPGHPVMQQMARLLYSILFQSRTMGYTFSFLFI